MHDDATETALAQMRDRYQQLLDRLEDNQSQFHNLARSALRVQEDERRRIARELHDGIGQNLTAIKHQLAMLLSRLPAAAAEVAKGVGACCVLCAQSLEDTRQLSRLLRPQVLDDLGLEAALNWLARSVQDAGRVQVAVHLEPVPELDPELQTLLFRVCQEALANVVRHSQATDAMLRLGARGGRIELTVWDNGCGFDVASAAGAAARGAAAGLSGMRERLAIYGGLLRIDSDAEAGTWLRASVPSTVDGRGA
jgi:signal transduction histidine kinase